MPPGSVPGGSDKGGDDEELQRLVARALVRGLEKVVRQEVSARG